MSMTDVLGEELGDHCSRGGEGGGLEDTDRGSPQAERSEGGGRGSWGGKEAGV